MGQKRGRAEGSFVRETAAQAVEFYRDLVQNLKPWQELAPKLRTPGSDDSAQTDEPSVPAWVGQELTPNDTRPDDTQRPGHQEPSYAE